MMSDMRTNIASRRILLYGLGSLWLLDGVLQMQPGMFTMDMVSTIMQPAATGEPSWLNALINWSIGLVTPHLAAFNWAVVVIQLGIGVLLLMPRRNLVTAGLWLSIGWGLVVWLFGEGLGQLFSGTSTFLTGAPGSVLIYVAASVLLLWPKPLRRGFDVASYVVAVALLFGAALQFSPVYWTGLGLAAPFGSGAMMQQPLFIRHSLAAVATLASASPVALNAGIIAVNVLLGLLVWLRPSSRAALWSALAWLALTWWFGQDLGMLFSGMATDPNTAPVLALLLWAGFASHREQTAPASLQADARSFAPSAQSTAS
jgi:hypothetical protein